MLDSIRGWFESIISDPIGVLKNWWIGIIAGMILGSRPPVSAAIDNFLSRVSGGRL